MTDAVVTFMSRYGYLAVLLLIAAENIFPPIPSEVILTFGGFLTAGTDMTPFGVIVAATAGSLIGAWVLYGLGRCLSAERLDRFFGGRIGRLLGFKPGAVTRASGRFERGGRFTVCYCRCIPIIRSIISVPAGTARMPLLPFSLCTAVGAAVWNTLLVMLGVLAGSRWETISGFIGTYGKWITVAVIAAWGLRLIIRRIGRLKASPSKQRGR